MDTLDATQSTGSKEQNKTAEKQPPHEFRGSTIREVLGILGLVWAVSLLWLGFVLIISRFQPFLSGSDGLIWTAIITGAAAVVGLGVGVILDPRRPKLFLTVWYTVVVLGAVSALCVDLVGGRIGFCGADGVCQYPHSM